MTIKKVPSDITLVEFVCLGNEERSACAEIFAADYVRIANLEETIAFTSSGTHVEKMRRVIVDEDYDDTAMDLSNKIKIVTLALQNGVYQTQDAEEAHELLLICAELGNHSIPIRRLNGIYRQAKVDFGKIRDRELKRILGQYGLEMQHKPRQFIPRHDVNYIFGMGDQNTEIVAREYSCQEFRPRLITSFHTYIGIDPIRPCIMQTDPRAFDRFGEYLSQNVPLLVRKVIGEIGYVTQ